MKNKNAVKILLGLMLCLCMIFQLAPMSANALDSSIIAHDDNCGADGADLTWTLDSDGTLTISGEGAMMDWESFNGAPWYSKKSNIKKVVIEDGVTTVGKNAFYDCSKIESVTIGDDVTSIGNDAFNYCYALANITFGEKLETIGGDAFYKCSALTNITFGENLKTIDSWAFYCCESLTSVAFGENLQSIGGYAFYSCTGLKSVTLGEKLETIGYGAFDDCDSLSAVSVPCTWIENPLYSFDVGVAVTNRHTVETGECSVCNSVMGYCGATDNEGDEKSVQWVLAEDGTLTVSGQGKMGATPAWNAADVKVVIIGSGISEIPSGVFNNCTNLKVAVIPCTWGEKALYTFPNDVIKVVGYAVEGAVCPDCGNIGGSCGAADNVGGEKSVQWMLTDDGTLTISGIGAMKTWDNYDAIPWYSAKDNIKKVVIGDGVTTVGKYAFNSCSKIESVTIGDDVTSIGQNAFRNCDALTEVALPDSVTTISSYAFYDCAGLKSVSFGKNLETIGSYAFSYCNALTEVALPDSITTIDGGAFSDCAGLKSVSFSKNLETIGSYAFRSCNALTEVVLPDSITTISSYAFYNCTGLKSVSFGEKLESIGSDAFKNCTGLTMVSVPCTWIDNPLYSFSVSTTKRHQVETGECSVCNSVLGYCGTADNEGGAKSVQWMLTEDGTLTIFGQGKLSSAPTWKADDITVVIIDGGITSIPETVFDNCANLKLAVIPCAWGENALYTFQEGVTAVVRHTVETVVCPDCGNIGGSCGAVDNVGGEMSVQWMLTDDGTFTISGIGAMKEWWSSSQLPWDSARDNIKKVIIGDGVTTVGKYAFYDCDNLTEVDLPDSLESIISYAFSYCEALKTIDIPDSLETISNSAFSYCSALTEVVLPKSLKYIDVYAFYNCSALKKVTFAGNPETVSSWAFNGCPLEEAVVPCTWNFENPPYEFEGVESVVAKHQVEQGECSTCGQTVGYCGADGDGKLVLWALDSEGVLTISGQGAMADSAPDAWAAADITVIVIGSGITEIPQKIFDDCEALKVAVVPCTWDDEEPLYDFSGEVTVLCGHTNVNNECSDCGVVSGFCGAATNVGGEKSVQWTLSADGTTLTISGVGAMENWQNYSTMPWINYVYDIKAIVVEDGVTTVGDYAFNNFEYLESVTLGSDITYIGCSAFVNCGSLTDITIPDKVETIGEDAFGCCYELSEIIIPDSVTTIDRCAFYCCSSLKEIVIPDSVSSLGNEVFSYCSQLEKISFGRGIQSFGEYMFNGCPRVSLVYAPCTWAENPLYRFDDSVSVLWIHAVDQGKCSDCGIGADYCGADDDGKNLMWTLENGVLTISGQGAMADSEPTWNAADITTIIIGGGVTNIPENVFDACTALKTVEAPCTWEDDALYEFGSDVTVHIDHVPVGNKCESCGISAGYCGAEEGGKNLRWTLVDGKLTVYGTGEMKSLENELDNNPSFVVDKRWGGQYNRINEIVIEEGVTSIGADAFCAADGGSNVKKITIEETVTAIDARAFKGCYGLETVVIPDSVVAIGERAFAYTEMKEITIGFGATSIHEKAFESCYGLNTVNVPCTWNEIPYYVFDDDVTVNALHKEENGKCTVCDGILGYCGAEGDGKNLTWSLKDGQLLIFGSGAVKEYDVGSYPWSEYADDITSVYLGAEISSIAADAFADCENLQTVEVRCNWNVDFGENVTLEYYHVLNDDGCVLCDYIGGYCGAEPGGRNLSWTLEDSTIIISGTGEMKDYAFCVGPYAPWYWLSEKPITKVVIEDGVTSIGTHAFYYINNLEEVEISDTVTEIRSRAFNDCGALTTITLGAGIEIIQEDAFAGCASLSTVNLPCTWDKDNPPFDFEKFEEAYKNSGYEMEITLNYAPHVFEEEWYCGYEDGHYKCCDVCATEVADTFEDHVSEDGDAICDLCYETMSHTCVYENGWYHIEGDYHYKECDLCYAWNSDEGEEHCNTDDDVFCDLCSATLDHECVYETDNYYVEDDYHYSLCDLCSDWDYDKGEKHYNHDNDVYCDACETMLPHECKDANNDTYCDLCDEYTGEVVWVYLRTEYVDAEGNPADLGAPLYAQILPTKVWIDDSGDVGSNPVAVGENILTNWECDRDEYVLPEDITFTCDQNGNITITSGNATLQEGLFGYTYIVVELEKKIPAEITEVKVTVDGKDYTAGKVPITPETKSIVYTVTGTNFDGLGVVPGMYWNCTLFMAQGLESIISSSVWTIDGNTATLDCSESLDRFMQEGAFTVNYSNAASEDYIDTDITLIYCEAHDFEDSVCTICGSNCTHVPAAAVEENRVESSCTVAGSYDEVVYCAVCKTHEIARTEKKLEVLEHTKEVLPAVESTCTASGLTEGAKCSVCGEVLVKQTAVPVKEHSFHDGKCSACGAKDPDYVEPEDPKPEDPKPEDPKPEDPKPEDPKPEDPKPEDPKPEDPKPEDPKPEDPKPEDPKPEDPKPDDPKPEDPKPEDPKPEDPKPEDPKPEDPKPEDPKPEDPKPEDPKPEDPKPNGFKDVAAGAYYYDAVQWAVKEGITTGTGDGTTFSPNANCTRAQVVTFLWRAAGTPEPNSAEMPFTDVAADAYYYKAVLWAVENGITSGVTATTFAPGNPCTRGQIATFLWRAAGSPEPQNSDNPFSDVNAGPFYKAILWAAEQGITTGYEDGSFRPNSICTRGHIVTFLYRAK